jgi:hypothetical protein
VRATAWRQSDGGEEVAVEVLGAGHAWAWREEKEGGERCSGGWRSDVALTWAREAVRWPGDDGKAMVAEELGGGGTRARRGQEDSGDGCGEDRASVSTSYRGWREAEAPGIQWPPSMSGLEDAGY